MKFGEYIRIKRLEKDFTLREFCRKVEIDVANFSKMERGKMKPHIDNATIKKMSKLLNLDYKTLIARKYIDLCNLFYYKKIDDINPEYLPVFVPPHIVKDEVKLKALIDIINKR